MFNRKVLRLGLVTLFLFLIQCSKASKEDVWKCKEIESFFPDSAVFHLDEYVGRCSHWEGVILKYAPASGRYYFKNDEGLEVHYKTLINLYIPVSGVLSQFTDKDIEMGAGNIGYNMIYLWDKPLPWGKIDKGSKVTMIAKVLGKVQMQLYETNVIENVYLFLIIDMRVKE